MAEIERTLAAIDDRMDEMERTLIERTLAQVFHAFLGQGQIL
jgi:hypothetical protein